MKSTRAEEPGTDVVACPVWCIEQDHGSVGRSAVHYGPTFGRIDSGRSSIGVTIEGPATAPETTVWLSGEKSLNLDPDSARRLAKHLRAAAAWIERGGTSDEAATAKPSATSTAPRYVSRRSAAEMCQVGLGVIDKAIHSGALRARKVGGVIQDGERVRFRYRIDVKDLEKWFGGLPEAW